MGINEVAARAVKPATTRNKGKQPCWVIYEKTGFKRDSLTCRVLFLRMVDAFSSVSEVAWASITWGQVEGGAKQRDAQQARCHMVLLAAFRPTLLLVLYEQTGRAAQGSASVGFHTTRSMAGVLALCTTAFGRYAPPRVFRGSHHPALGKLKQSLQGTHGCAALGGREKDPHTAEIKNKTHTKSLAS